MANKNHHSESRMKPIIRQKCLNGEDEHLLDQIAMSEMLGIKKKTAEMWRIRGRGPQFVKVGSLVRYRRQDILDYIGSNIARSTSEVLPDDVDGAA